MALCARPPMFADAEADGPSGTLPRVAYANSLDAHQRKAPA